MNESLDRQLLEELKMVMEEDFPALLETYLEDSERQFFEAREALEAGDHERLRRSAHSLKGASSNVGAAELALLCGQLERQAHERRPEGLTQTLALVQAELREVRDAVAQVRGDG